MTISNETLIEYLRMQATNPENETVGLLDIVADRLSALVAENRHLQSLAIPIKALPQYSPPLLERQPFSTVTL